MDDYEHLIAGKRLDSEKKGSLEKPISLEKSLNPEDQVSEALDIAISNKRECIITLEGTYFTIDQKAAIKFESDEESEREGSETYMLALQAITIKVLAKRLGL